jgi:GntR family transcriptional regulator/MocR family aminotransferase
MSSVPLSAQDNCKSPRGARRVRRHGWADLLAFGIDPASPEPKATQVQKFLQRAILSGAAPPGSRLPSTRILAERLGVSRTTILSAFAQLLAEGYITVRESSGSFVAPGLQSDFNPANQTANEAVSSHKTILSVVGQRYDAFPRATFTAPSIPFNNAVVASDARTIEVWRALVNKRLRVLDSATLSYGPPGGTHEIRAIVATYLRAARGVRCEAGQVILLSGAQQALDLILRILLDPGAEVWVEDPGYLPTSAALIAAGIRTVPVPVDADGMQVIEGIRRSPRACAAFVTPSHQFPLGCAMSMQRRLELLAWARESGAWVVEDDFDSEFRYSGKPLASLQGLDDAERVIYVGTFSKVLFPGLRLGYAVVPPALVHAFEAAHFLTDRFAPTILQGALCEFMQQGHFTAHIRRMRARYEAKRDLLLEYLGQLPAGRLSFDRPAQGLHLIARLEAGVQDSEFSKAALEAGVFVRPVSPMYSEAPKMQALVMGYAGFDAHQMRSAVARLAKLFEGYPADTRRRPWRLQSSL